MNELAIEYETDFYAWLIRNARLMKQGRLSEIDTENIAEELEGMSRSEKQQLVNRLSVLLAHLLKWRYEPDKRSHSWKYTIREQRKKVRQLLKNSPSLKYQIEDKLADAYDIAISKAAKETRLDESSFPADCPFSIELALDDDFYPPETNS